MSSVCAPKTTSLRTHTAFSTAFQPSSSFMQYLPASFVRIPLACLKSVLVKIQSFPARLHISLLDSNWFRHFHCRALFASHWSESIKITEIHTSVSQLFHCLLPLVTACIWHNLTHRVEAEHRLFILSPYSNSHLILHSYRKIHWSRSALSGQSLPWNLSPYCVSSHAPINKYSFNYFVNRRMKWKRVKNWKWFCCVRCASSVVWSIVGPKVSQVRSFSLSKRKISF